MRVRIHKRTVSGQMVMVVPARRAHLAPVTLTGSDPAAVMEQVRITIDEVAIAEKTPFPRDAVPAE